MTRLTPDVTRMSPDIFHVREEVSEALSAGRPVVALESTIITHGMPYPDNLEVALRLESIVRENGAVPATLAIIDGKITVGAEPDAIDRLAVPGNSLKIGVRDIAVACALRKSGGTTVSATMAISAMAGIRVFATGGIGGVHRGAQNTMDISSDLIELSRSPVCVVCAGAKAILDIGLTLEYLETHGVPVIGYGTGEFPAFYTRRSGHRLEWVVEAPEQVAGIMEWQWDRLRTSCGILLANPIPPESELDSELVDTVVSKALLDAKRHRISGKELTPFLLSAVESESRGATLTANKALVENNARIAARVAVAYAGRAKRE